MSRDREVIARRLREARERDPVAAAKAVENLAISSPPTLTFAESIADVLVEARPPGAGVTAFDELLLDHLVSLGPRAYGQLLRVTFSACLADIVVASLAHEASALGPFSREHHRLPARLAVPLVGVGADETFGWLLQDAMGRGHEWSATNWEALISRSDEVREAATRVVWKSGDQTFRLTPEGERLDADDESVDAPSERVFVPHALDFDEGEASQWGRVFAEYDIVALFPQFDRTQAHLPPSWERRDAVPLHRGLSWNAAICNFVRRGWTLRTKGSRSYFDRQFRGDTLATVNWHRADTSIHLIELYFGSTTGAPRYLGDIPEVAYSEALLTFSEFGVVGS